MKGRDMPISDFRLRIAEFSVFEQSITQEKQLAKILTRNKYKCMQYSTKVLTGSHQSSENALDI
jgi:hypothetical protein